jgi:hypothetical protein
MRTPTSTNSKTGSDLPGAVESRKGISIILGMIQELQKIIAGNDTWGNDISESHGRRAKNTEET